MRLESRRRLLPALVFLIVFLIPLGPAWQADARPGTAYWDLLRGNLPVSCGLFLFVLIPSPILKPASALPEDQMRCFQYAVRTGILPLASLFRDWTTELAECRRGLERVLRALPATILVSFGSTVYAAAVLPGSYGYFLMNAAMSVFLGLVLIELTRARLRNVGSLEEQLQLQNHYLRTSITKL
ncbi:hypothetical protein ARTSIC4J27_383 [Pseudarthrobacter siccitolerans]|uniref:Uncharacterized protein n=1 Tax=Pseudarthrobacter siccitolerans TaxID=861266 RepID=A0A024GXZ8_9MICC|nr:hypothetical protein [Pseudarthrobacter siccitolerans]CCQ44457.1 hypothetical protein ARTSIC4J27_383 [Pseudarthrobacter siccitolerans]